MSRLTDDEIRAIWQVLPLDQEPTVENLIAYVKQIEQNINREHEVETEYFKLDDELKDLWRQLSRLNRQYETVMNHHIDLATRNSHISTSANKYYELRNSNGINKLLSK